MPTPIGRTCSVGSRGLLRGRREGELSLYGQRLEAGYSAPGLNTPTDTDQYGGTFADARHGRAERHRQGGPAACEKQGSRDDRPASSTSTTSSTTAGALERGRPPRRAARTTHRSSPVTQEQGDRTDAVVQVGFDSRARWRTYVFGQETLAKTGDREDNNRVGVGGAYRVNDRLAVDGEVSDGDLGPAVKLGTIYQQSEHTQLYLNYALENERGDERPPRAPGQPDLRREDPARGQRERLPRGPLPAHGLVQRPDAERWASVSRRRSAGPSAPTGSSAR